MKNKKFLTIIILALVLLLGAFFRFWQLNDVPPGLWPDEAMNANDAFYTLENKEYKLFYPDNNGREGLFMWLIALSFSFFGVSIWSLKFFSAIAGTFTVLGIYLLTNELLHLDKNFVKEKVYRFYLALIASLLLATSFWHINFSRIAFRAIITPLVLTFFFYFLLRGFRTQKIFNFILSGIFFGIGFYTYIPFRIVPLIVLLALFLFLIIYIREKNLKKYLLFVFIFSAFAFVVASPMFYYFLNNMGDFIGRAGQVSIFDAQNPIKELLKSTAFHFGMFNIFGDPNWRHNYSGNPMIPIPLGLLFLIGLFYSIKRFFSSLILKDIHALVLYSILLSWLFIMLLPGILTTEGIPHALRVISVIPPIYILIIFGGYLFYKFLASKIKNKNLLIVLSVTFLLLVSGYEINKYFFQWAKNPEVEKAFTKTYVEIGNYLNSLPEEDYKYVIINEPGAPIHGISISAQTPMFIEKTEYNKTRAKYIKFEELNKVIIESDKKTWIIPLYGKHTVEKINDYFPIGSIKEKNGVFIYEIDKNYE